jgi:hypothetical protein
MIVTDEFVFIHFPKAGGTFVTQVLEKIYEKRQKKIFRRKPLYRNFKTLNTKWIIDNNQEPRFTEHGSYDQIPDEFKNKPVISVIRNPFDRCVSLYEFRQWVQNPFLDIEKNKKYFPAFPELNFEEYLEFLNSLILEKRTYYRDLKIDIGSQTYDLIEMFFKNPLVIFKNLDESYIDSENYKNDMAKIIFLRMENLNRDLYSVLIDFGYAKKDISFILDEKKIFPIGRGRSEEQKWECYYNYKMYEFIRHKERFFLKIFPEYNIDLF